jgi:hypothetical protein
MNALDERRISLGAKFQQLKVAHDLLYHTGLTGMKIPHEVCALVSLFVEEYAAAWEAFLTEWRDAGDG